MNETNEEKFNKLLKKRWDDFYYTYVWQEYNVQPEIPKEIIDKFKLEIKEFANLWSENDLLVTEIIDTHIRTYWQNQLLEYQNESCERLKSTTKVCIITLTILVIILLISLCFHFLSSKNNKKNQFYNDLLSYRYCDSYKVDENGDIICKIKDTKYILIYNTN